MESEFVYIKSEDTVCYRVEKVINNSKYRIDFHPYIFTESLRLYVSVSSGKKKKELNFSSLEKQNNSDGGIKALFWYKQVIKELIERQEDIIKWYSDYKNIHIIVQWEDKKRRDVYTYGLKDLGFYITHDLGNKCLKLKIK